MFKYIGTGEVLNLFVFPFIGLILNLAWVFLGNKKDKQNSEGKSGKA